MAAKTFRVIDTGIRDGRRQIAFDQAMIEARKEGKIPDTRVLGVAAPPRLPPEGARVGS